MLDVWPIDISPRKFKIGFDRFRGVIRVADNQPTDDKHLVAVDILNRLQRGIPDDMAMVALFVFGARPEKAEVPVENILDAQEHIAEAGFPHEWRQRLSV